MHATYLIFWIREWSVACAVQSSVVLSILVIYVLFVLYLWQKYANRYTPFITLQSHWLKFAFKIQRKLLISTVAAKLPAFVQNVHAKYSHRFNSVTFLCITRTIDGHRDSANYTLSIFLPFPHFPHT